MTDWLLLQDGAIIYGILFVALMGGAIGLPIPEDLPLIAGGVLAHRGQADLKLILLVCYAGILLGDIVIYAIGRRFGTGLFQTKWFKKRVSQSRLRNMRLRMERRSLLMIFVARHLFYLRTATFLTCGAVKMRISTFIIADAVAALISAPLMVGIGFVASEHWEYVVGWIHRLKEWSLLLMLPVLIGGYWYWNKHLRHKKSTKSELDETEPQDQQELP